MSSFWDAITGAPWWVYALFIYLVIIGIQATKQRTVSIKRLILLPLFFAAWSFYNLFIKLNTEFSVSLLICWVIGLAIGTLLGVWEVHAWKIHADRHKGQITIPGNYSTLILILIIFSLNFLQGYLSATQTIMSFWTHFFFTAASSFVTGFFIGRAALFFKRYHEVH